MATSGMEKMSEDDKSSPGVIQEKLFPEQLVIPILPQDQRDLDRKILRKIDLLILPICALNHFFSAMDRSDIGNAKLAGFSKDNHLSAIQFSVVVSMFQVGAILCQPVGGLLILRYIEAYLLLGFGNIFWGICTVMLIFSTGMILPSILRILIGIAEGLTQVNIIFLTMWYTKEEMATRTGFWMSFGALAGAINGLMAWGIQHNIHSPTLKSWQILFLMEGAFPILFGPLILHFYPSSPSKVKKYFSEAEKEICIARTQRAGNTVDRASSIREAMPVFRCPETYGMFVAHFCVIWASAGYSNFLPIIIDGLGFSAVESQLLTVPVCVVSFLSVNLFCWFSDRLQLRGPLIMGLAMVSVIGFTMLAALSSAKGPRTFALYLISLSVYPLIPLTLTFLCVNTVGLSRRALVIPIQNVFGLLGGLVVNYTYIHKPRYLEGTLGTIGCLCILIVTIAALDLSFIARNRAKASDVGSEQWENNRTKSFDELGTDHPDFKFTV
ncbi:MFS general substrate transporter [Penicillium verhagenii]|nr:MFS general substrate transporter [Penicillium verhagenii]